MELPDDVLQDLQALAGVALAHEELDRALEQICRIATRAVASASGTSLTTFDASGPRAAAADGDWARNLDEMQYAEREGPCIDAARTGALFRVRDAGNEPRWPSYMPRAHDEGARSMVSIPLTVEAKTIGAMNVYSRDVDAFGPEESSIVEVIAAHAGLAAQVSAVLHGHRTLADQLREAMESRARIEQAKGIIMNTAGCDPDTAFRRLVEQSNFENRKLRDIADELVRNQIR